MRAKLLRMAALAREEARVMGYFHPETVGVREAIAMQQMFSAKCHAEADMYEKIAGQLFPASDDSRV